MNSTTFDNISALTEAIAEQTLENSNNFKEMLQEIVLVIVLILEENTTIGRMVVPMIKIIIVQNAKLQLTGMSL